MLRAGSRLLRSLLPRACGLLPQHDFVGVKANRIHLIRVAAMSCKDVTEFLSDYLDGALPMRQRLAFKLHLLMCRDCRKYLDSYVTTVKLANTLRKPTEPEEVLPIPEELVQAILAVRGRDEF